MPDFLGHAENVLYASLQYVADPAGRLYWVCLLSALALASLTVSIHARRFDVGAQLRALFNASYWFNRSTAEDLGWVVVNTIVRVVLLVPLFGSHLIGTLAVGGFLQEHAGNAPSLELPWYLIASLFTLCFFLVEDLSRFSLHYAMHRSDWLWRCHRIHHSATTLTPITLFRIHPVEQVLYFTRGFLVFGLVSGVFVWLFQGKLTGWQVLGVDAVGFLFNLIGANLRHSHVWLSFGALERWFISPAQHQLHHSVRHGHRNLGTCLALWDRLASTLLRSGEKPAELQFGLDAHALAIVKPG